MIQSDKNIFASISRTNIYNKKIQNDEFDNIF